MRREPHIFESVDDAAEDAADAEAIADIEAGRTVPHEQVAAWLRTWGTPDETPPPKAWFK